MTQTGKRLLLVDDSELVVTMLSDHLESEGYEILVANDGEAGFARVLADKPDLIITDVQMPKMSGHDLTRKLRATDATKALPIIMITTLSTMEDRIAGIESGADDFINKPFNKQILMLKIRNLLKSSAQSVELAVSYAEAKKANEELQKLQKRQKYWMEVVGEEIRNTTANLQVTLSKLEKELTLTGPESSTKLAKYASEYAKTLNDRLEKVFKEEK